MNEEHYGPHCAGHCEGAAYQIEIQKLRHDIESHLQIISNQQAEIEMLRDALKKVEAFGHNMAQQALAAHNKGGSDGGL